MDRDRIIQIQEDYHRAVARLAESLTRDVKTDDVYLDGVIQRFEFCFELGWKLAKALLEYGGIEVSVPRAVIKEAFQKGLVQNGEDWLEMLEDRNKTSHLYDQTEAMEIYEKIKNRYGGLLSDLETSAASFFEKIRTPES